MSFVHCIYRFACKHFFWRKADLIIWYFVVSHIRKLKNWIIERLGLVKNRFMVIYDGNLLQLHNLAYLLSPQSASAIIACNNGNDDSSAIQYLKLEYHVIHRVWRVTNTSHFDTIWLTSTWNRLVSDQMSYSCPNPRVWNVVLPRILWSRGVPDQIGPVLLKISFKAIERVKFRNYIFSSWGEAGSYIYRFRQI